MDTEARAILVVDDDGVSRRVIEQALARSGLPSVSVSSGRAAIDWLAEREPLLVLLDLVMPDPDGYAVLAHLKGNARLSAVPVIVLTALDSDEEIERVFASGADDYVHKPFRNAELVARVRGQLRMQRYVDRLSRRDQDLRTVLELTQALASSHGIRDILFVVVQRVAEVARVDRCSIVLTSESTSVGHVVATSDDEQLRDLSIDLQKYPEIREVLDTGRPLVIRDAMRHPLLSVVHENEPAFDFVSVALMPILHDHGPLGVIFLRSRTPAAFDEHEMSLVNTVANATAIALQNARTFQSLRDETQQSAFARVEAERRVQLFQRYADFFESAADGMVVINRLGRVLFANPRAREITGFVESELMGLPFEQLLATTERERARRLVRGFGEGIYPRGVDITINTKRQEPLIVNVSFSSVLHEDNAVVFSFRDVTQERKTAIELKQTKDFLERVIDGSVDSIVYCDLRGRVLLFNRAAARMFAYNASEVIGSMHAEALYPPGVAREVMKKIRDPEVNGYGRLEDYRVDMIGAGGEIIPVTLSAALVMENGKPIGSVGIFTDIREKLRMEARLMKAQEELRTREKQSIVAELAGAAAHELNQPLTSISGYAELLRRNLTTDPVLANAASVIVTEAERMAEIVRKIGKITRYETKSYVGGAKILDLEKASEDDAVGEDLRR